MRSDSYDVLVVGGGPGGAAAAAILARGGRSVALLERDPEPRFKVGESLMPQTYWTFERMGALERMKKSSFVPKHSVQFFGRSGKPSAPFYFRDEVDHESAQTWQVLRSDFDQLLLETAAEQGAECCRGVTVRDLLVDEQDRVTGVRVSLADGSTRELEAKVVIDATGQSTLVAKRFALEKVDYGLRHASIFTHVRGARRDSGIDEGATLILQTEERESWFWYIPLADDVVSVGVVGGVDYLIRERTTKPEETFWEEVRRCPPVEERIAEGEVCRPFAVLKDFSYRWTRMAGDGWILIGDAFSFVDPVYSSGVFLALKSGEMAADAALGALARDNFSEEILGAFQPRLMQGIDAVRRLVEAFYDRDFSFGTFLERHPQHQSGVTRILIGDVFDRDFGPLFADMAQMRRSPATSAAGAS
jgi:flavin-dependent dehydrogenase